MSSEFEYLLSFFVMFKMVESLSDIIWNLKDITSRDTKND